MRADRYVLVAALAVTGTARLAAQCPDGTPPPCGRARAAAPPANSVAVLYFDNLSRDTSDAYLADGLTEELMARLSQVERLQVKSRTAMQRLRGRPPAEPAALGRSLGVAHLVSGSVRRGGERLRVTVELTSAATGVSVWSRSFDLPAGDLLAVEAVVAESVAVGVGGRLAPGERQRLVSRPTANPTAYDRFLRGNFQLARRTTTGLLRAIQEYETAVRLDPAFVLAMVLGGQAYGMLGGTYYGPEARAPRDTLFARGRALIDRALRLDSTSAEAWIARAAVAGRDSLSAAALGRAVAIDPRNAEARHVYGVLLRDLGEDSAAAREFRHALALDPDRAITLENLGMLFVVGRQFVEGRRWLDSAVALRPEAPFYYLERALALLQLGDTAGARAAAEEVARHGDVHGREEILSLIEARAGDSAMARSRLAPVDSALRGRDCFLDHACLGLAYALASVGARDRALTLLERIRPRDNWLWYWSRRVELDPIRDDPRFQRLVTPARPQGWR